MSERTVVIKKATGRQTIPMNPSADMLFIDMDIVSRKIIAEFVKAVLNRHYKDKPLTPGDIAALAIGKFEVSLDDIYDGTVESLSQLDDRTLAQIFRIREEEREANADRD